jgi:hypothetical protein
MWCVLVADGRKNQKAMAGTRLMSAGSGLSLMVRQAD